MLPRIAFVLAALVPAVCSAAVAPRRVEPPFPTEFARRAAKNQLNLSREAADWGISFEARKGAAFRDAVGATFEATAVLKDPDTVSASP